MVERPQAMDRRPQAKSSSGDAALVSPLSAIREQQRDGTRAGPSSLGGGRTAVAGRSYDAVVVGSGPNGMAAAITIARAGRSVLVIEGQETIGGGARTADVTLPGFHHDICSAVHPMGVASPFFRSLPLADLGVEWVYSPAEMAHPLDHGSAIVVKRSLQETSEQLGRDAKAYRRLLEPLVEHWQALFDDTLAPLHIPRHPLILARLGLVAPLPATVLARTLFREEKARALMAGMAEHSILSLRTPITTAFGLMMAVTAHAVGWPVARGGSQSITNALAAYLRSLGGEIIAGWNIETMAELPSAQAILFDVTPRQLLRIAGDRLPTGYRRQLEHYRYGPGVYKLDLALDGPIPWQAPECATAATVHVGGTMQEIVASEEMVWQGRHPDRPFVLVAQASLFDSTRAPAGKQTVWAYCHVPNGSTVDMTERIEKQIERFAPGFKDRILARSIMPPAAMERHNSNYIGGDINGGIQDIFQFYTRPAPRLNPYTTPVPGLYICSSSTPPGGGVHGMCGFWAAQAALQSVLSPDNKF